MSIQRSLPWLIAAAALAGALGLFLGQRFFADPAGAPTTRTALVYPQARPLSDFSLERADNGGRLTLADWRGHWSLVFIGFTHCPDACPQTLAVYRDIEKAWPADAGKVPTLYFVSVDPERDSAQAIREYAEHFSASIVPARGEHEQLQPFTRQLGMIYMKTPLEGDDYTVDHSTQLAVIAPDGRLAALFRMPLSAPDIVEDLLTLSRRQPS